MFQPLPAETVFEAKTQTLRHTRLLFSLLVLIYVAFFNLSASIFCLIYTHQLFPKIFLQPFLIVNALAFIFAVAHFSHARSKDLTSLITELHGQDADPNDDIHRRFLNIVQEAETASGFHPIRAVVLATTARNAFSIEDGKGRKAIGVTEGLLSALSRPELSAVVAHETAHLLHGDSRLMTTACSLFSVFGRIAASLNILGESGRSSGYRSRSDRSSALLFLFLVWVVAVLGTFFTQLIYFAISRNREYYADSDGVHICQDPLALSDALQKIWCADRGHLSIPEGFGALFIVNCVYSGLDESEGFASDLFCTHPPVKKRLQRLADWAMKDPAVLETHRKIFENAQTEPSYALKKEGGWSEPQLVSQILAQGPVSPLAWVLDRDGVWHASDIKTIQSGLREQMGKNAEPFDCPRCKIPLIEDEYESCQTLKCAHCVGRLLGKGHLERIVARRTETFDPKTIERTGEWRARQKGSVKELCFFPQIHCPRCQADMFKCIYTELTRVVLDYCQNQDCASVWCDAMELEHIQILIENPYMPTF